VGWVLFALGCLPAFQPTSHDPAVLAWLFRKNYWLVVGALLFVACAPLFPTRYNVRTLLVAMFLIGLILAIALWADK
jgi:hypothetical protein